MAEPPLPTQHDLEHEQATPSEMLSPAEERFERWRRTSGAILAPLAFVLVYFVLLRDSTLGEQGKRLSAILATVAVLWITETIPLPVTAILGASLCVLLGVADAEKAFSGFANPMIFLFLGSFILARAMSIHRLDRRIALGFLSLKSIGGRPGAVLAGLGAVTALLSMWVSNTATTAMMLPIALGILTALHTVRVRSGLASGPLDARRWPFATGMLLMIAYAASIGGIGTKVGSPPNLITLGHLEKIAGRNITFFKWMAVMVPMLAVMGVVLFFLLYTLHPDRSRRDTTKAAPDREPDVEARGLASYLQLERERLGPWTAGQRNTLVAFALAVTLWILPGFLQAFAEEDKPKATSTTQVTSAPSAPTPLKRAVAFFGTKGQMPEAVVALIAALLLFVLPVNLKHGQFTLTWSQAVGIDWGTLLLFGGGIALGDLMFQTGVAKALGDWAVAKTGAQSMWALTAAMIALGIFLSETTSNTAAATMLAPIAISMALNLKVSPTPPALGACLGASYGFMLPVSTPPNAIVFGSGLVPITKMMRAGMIFDVVGFGIIWTGLRLLCPPLGLI
jgi:sodium-dependent dicarboxylate transporter 2/3/5